MFLHLMVCIFCVSSVCMGGTLLDITTNVSTLTLQTVFITEPQYAPYKGYCAVLCDMDIQCSRALYVETDSMCHLSSYNSPSIIMHKNEPDDTSLTDALYSTTPGTMMQLNVAPTYPSHCTDILVADPLSQSGVYFIWPGSDRLRVWCDMDTDGGGWTMVYSYTMASATYTSGANAVTPIPTWPITATTSVVERSSIPPSDIKQYGAMDFPLWQTIGEEVMVKTNINNWIACLPDIGSFTRWVQGQILCRMIKSITSTCPTLPSANFRFQVNFRGAIIRANNYYYYFDGTTNGDWPTHDPCGANSANHIPGLTTKGQIWVR